MNNLDSRLLFLLCSFLHFTGGILFLRYGLVYSVIYNFAAGLIYLFFLYISSSLPESFLFVFMIGEVLAYSLLFTIETGNDAGTLLLDLNLASIVFIALRKTRQIRRYFSIISCMIFAVVAAVLYIDFSRTVFLPGTFYAVNFSVCLASTSTIILYIAGMSEAQIKGDKEKQAEHLERLYFLANHDPLTGLINRRELNRLLLKCKIRKDTDGQDYAFTIFDIDNFKKFNDTYGHDCGDFILKEMTKAISLQVPGYAHTARWGGEEFAILFTEQTESVPVLLDTLRRKIALMRFSYRNAGNLSITLTFGVSSSGTCKSLHDILITADSRLMYGKQNGKNCVVTEKGIEGRGNGQ